MYVGYSARLPTSGCLELTKLVSIQMLRLARSCPHRLFVSAILNLTESTYQLQFKSSIGDMLSLITQQYETAEPAIPALATLCNNAELRQELCDLHIPRLMLETLTSEKASDELKKHCLEFFARLAYDRTYSTRDGKIDRCMHHVAAVLIDTTNIQRPSGC